MTAVPTTEQQLTRWLAGKSDPVRRLRELILKVAPTGHPVWVEGETGAGKEQVAQAIHAASGRRGAFVAVNVCAIADSMFEDAFFGHVRGAFTGARDRMAGYVTEADGGTLFLDEISGLPVHVQVKLLRVVETGLYREVGASADRRSRARIISASNVPYETLLRQERFRLDLGYRLRRLVLHLPPLRERAEDIGVLVPLFLGATDVPTGRDIDGEALRWLSQRKWRGNVRELRSFVECAQLFARDRVLKVHDLEAVRGMFPEHEDSRPRESEESTRQREELRARLEACNWDTQLVAADLEVDRRTVYRRMQRLGLRRTNSSELRQ